MAANSAALSSFSFNAVNIPAVGSAAVSNSRPPIEITTIGQAKAYFIHGVISTTIALDVYFNKADHQTLHDAISSASAATAFVITFASLSTISGSALVTQFDIVASAGDVVRASITLQCTDTVTNLGTSTFDGALD